MRRIAALLFVTAPFVSCAPDLPAIGSRISAPRVLAVRAEPAEAGPGAAVRWQALVATPGGPVTDATIHWTFCEAPRSPTDSTTLSNLCLGDGLLADGGTVLQPFMSDGHVVAMGSMPTDACQKVGPQVPPTNAAMQRQRPPDPDITGGYYLPIRLQLTDPAAADSAFARTRLTCNPTDTPIDVTREFQQRYHANQNPLLAIVAVHDASGDRALVADDPSQAVSVASNTPITLAADWSADSVENYVLVDPVTRRVVDRTEQLEVTWFTNGGAFAHERTGADVAGGTRSSNTLRLDAGRTGTVTVWVVLHDDRGGVAFASFALAVH
jgi:hypothetical protein